MVLIQRFRLENRKILNNMRILHLSDTHNKHLLLHDLPAADVIVHSGDVVEGRSKKEVMDFFVWFCALDYKYKIFVAGNHDTCLHGVNLIKPTNLTAATICCRLFWKYRRVIIFSDMFTKHTVLKNSPPIRFRNQQHTPVCNLFL